ncbi:MAG: molybdopterin molybdotransferase MoeA [Clostridiales bacterium]|nr:molybdopterin molybdotransferase MoeA [Clostridiales bacterium]
MPILSFWKAYHLLAELPRAAAPEVIPLTMALSRRAAQNLVVPHPLPEKPRAAMDGYVLRSKDVPQGDWRSKVFSIDGSISVGEHPGSELLEGTCRRVVTGAFLPPGGDAVVPQEAVELLPEGLRLKKKVEPWENVMLPGEEALPGRDLLRLGQTLSARDLLVLASFGVKEVTVYRPLEVAVAITGSELSGPGEEKGPFEIRESTSFFLTAELSRLGLKIQALRRVRDDPASLAQTFHELLAGKPQVFITTGGVSVGPRDWVPHVWRELGAEILIEKVHMKPGKAFMAGRLGETWIFGLSGNPPAALVSFYALVKPALLRLSGGAPSPWRWGLLGEDVKKPPNRPRFLWSRAEGGIFYPLQDHPTLEALQRADHLILLEPRDRPYRKGDPLQAIPLEDLGHGLAGQGVTKVVEGAGARGP